MLENLILMEDGKAEVTPKPLAEFIWNGVMIGIASIILWFLLRALGKWRCPSRILEENLQNSHEILEIQRDGQRRISEEMSWKKPRRIVKEILQANGCKPLVELPLQKKDACKSCRLSSVVLEVELSIEAGRSTVHADGPSYHLSCVIGHSTKHIKSLIDTGCSCSAIDLKLVEMLGLLDQMDQSKRICYEAMGGERLYTYGMLHVPVRTLSGFLLIEELLVVETGLCTLIVGLDVLAVNNCSLILDMHRPILMARERDACCTFKGFDIRGSADVLAKLNGVLYKSTLDTGTMRTVVPDSLDFAQESLSKPEYCNVAAKDPVRITKKVTSLELEINGCVGRVDPYVMSEPHPMIGTDFLRNKKIDFIHGKVYVETLNFKRKC